MDTFLQISGGIGKSIAATAVIEAIKTQYKERVHVISGYPDVFNNNPDVKKVIVPEKINNIILPNFYSDYIRGKEDDVKVFLQEPYFNHNFLAGHGHLIKNWCDMCEVKYNGELPKFMQTNFEKKHYAKIFRSDKPFFILQTNGGAEQQQKYSWPRDIPVEIAQAIVDEFKKDYNIMHIRRNDQQALDGVTPVQADNIRMLAALINMSEKGLYLDSCGQHTAAALRKSGVVLWIGNRPEQLGYELHTNIIANPPTLYVDHRNTGMFRYNDDISQFPYNSIEEMFDVEEIITAVRNLPKTAEPEKTDLKKLLTGKKVVEV